MSAKFILMRDMVLTHLGAILPFTWVGSLFLVQVEAVLLLGKIGINIFSLIVGTILISITSMQKKTSMYSDILMTEVMALRSG